MSRKCGWNCREEDNYDDDGPLMSWIEHDWYCQTRQDVLYTYIVEDYQWHLDFTHERERKHCLCNDKPELTGIYLEVQKIKTDEFIDDICLTSTGLAKFNEWYLEGKLIDYYFVVGESDGGKDGGKDGEDKEKDRKDITKIGVHKTFLGLISPMFDQLFSSGFEMVQNEYRIDEDPKIVKKLVDWLYSGGQFETTFEGEFRMLELAQLLQIRGINGILLTFDLKSIKNYPEALMKYTQIILNSDLKLSPYFLAHLLVEHQIDELDWLNELMKVYPEIKKTYEYLEYLNY